jgi:hypothetical protein
MNGVAAPLSLEELDGLLARAEPGAVLAPPRILRRVIRQQARPSGPGVHVPHRECFVLSRDALLVKVEPEELGLPPERQLPETVLLLERPDPVWLARQERGKALRHYWRLLFHARVHQALGQRRRDGKLTTADVQARRQAMGTTEWAEVEAVLRQDHRLLPPEDVCTVYEEFAALYLELCFFDPEARADYFPTMEDFAVIDALLARDVDGEALLATTRLEGAAAAAEEEDEPAPPECGEEPQDTGTEAYRQLCARADQAHRSGNSVRAAILRQRAVCVAPPGQQATTQTAAEREIKQLVRRLRQALGGSAGEAERWRETLLSLLGPAASGTWSVEARLLYDLQKVCVDQERSVYAVDLVEWIVSWGQKPIKRELPHHQAVLTVKHLHRALYRLAGARLDEPTREELEGLLREAVHDSEERLRQRLRPILCGELEEIGLRPACVAETVARDKLIEELLDQVIERSFLTVGDLRDALARNRLKLPDLGGFHDVVAQQENSGKRGGAWVALAGLRSTAVGLARFFLGDPLIQLNRRLSTSLDGVYRRGEIYLRWLQRFSSLAFGTALGRVLTLYLIVPFGCSFMLLKMWDHIQELLGWQDEDEAGFHMDDLPSFLGLGVFFFLLLHARWFRRGLAHGLVLGWRGLRLVFHDWPAALLRAPWVQRILGSRTFGLLMQYAGKPLPPALVVAVCAYLMSHSPPAAAGAGVGTFVAVCLLVASRLGLYLEEMLLDFLERSWLLIRVDVLAGLGRLVLFIFKRLVEDVDRVLYTVDEWLRFRTGDNRLSLMVKPVLGLVWFLCTYVIRIIVNLFVEPTFNPIKHFPVVTVAAKLIFPLIPEMIKEITGALKPLTGGAVAGVAAAAMVFFLPGLAGFIVWELKENWRLYRANQSPTLDPEIVGHHGETVVRLMRPGLHSGTLPKLFARLRQSEGKRARRQQEALHQVEEALQRFAQRNLLAVLRQSRGWGEDIPLGVGHIHVGSKRLRLELCAPGRGSSVWLDFDEQGGWLLAGLHGAGDERCWLGQVSAGQRAALRNALAGFYKLAGAQLVREQIEAALPAGTPYALMAEGLVVWPDGLFEREAVYRLGGEAELRAQWRDGTPAEAPPVSREELVFAAMPVTWESWCRVWQEDQAGQEPGKLVPAAVLLPAASRQALASG